ncbi:MAG: undecaprenyl diphosphate synthase family protein [Methanocorpusculum sp.]|nr:undecaprenyl diphosphate synthase family protein [Methanocorpusculum sp.]
MLLYKIYEHSISKKLETFPKELCFILGGSDVTADNSKLMEVITWISEFHGIEKIIFHITCGTSDNIEKILPIKEISKRYHVRISTESKDETLGKGKPEILIVLGKSGRDEITDAIIKIAKENTDPSTITEETLESHLLYNVNPDFVIKTGGSHLTDFLIWQSVYSELFFTDVNWSKFRRVDFLRALRDYQSRKRNFGK